MNPTILAMFSGGLDSTGMLWKLLNENNLIHIHHMNLRNVERRAFAEHKAVSDILSYLSKNFEFTYSESTHQYPCFNKCFIWDSDIVSFMAGTICLSTPSIKNIAIGMTATDLNDNRLSDRIVRSSKILESFTPATKIYPVKDLKKSEIYNMLPVEIRKLTWSCRTPIYQNYIAHNCNKCTTCKTMAELEKND